MQVNMILAELIKLRRSYLLSAIIFFPVFINAILGFVQAAYASKMGWPFLINLELRLWALIMFPLATLAIVVIVTQIEHRNRTWPYIFALRTPRWTVIAIKVAIIWLSVAIATALFIIAMMSIGAIHLLLHDPLPGEVDFPRLVQVTCLLFSGGLWFVTILTWIGTRFQSPIALVVASAVFIFIGVTGIACGPLIGHAQPWMMYIPSVTAYAATTGDAAWDGAEWVGLIGAVLCLGGMLYHLSRREIN